MGTKQIFWFIAGIQTVIRYESAASSPCPDLPLFFCFGIHLAHSLSLCPVDCVDRVCVWIVCAHIRLDFVEVFLLFQLFFVWPKLLLAVFLIAIIDLY